MSKKRLKIIITLILIILLILGLTLITKKEQFVSNAIRVLGKNNSTTESVETSTQGLVLHADELIKESTVEEDMNHNTQYLQNLIDTVSDTGGGVVHIPAGTFYFTSGGINARGSENYVIKSRDNVLVEGEGTDESTGTILKPYGTPKNGLDMFYYNEFRDTYGADTTYIVNADFRNFIIDGEMAVGETYNTSGKGFMLNLYKDCNWENVIVRNTDATGFGMDNPINCTVKNCIAINCGKNATTDSAGASGFGIGTGFSEEDSIHISNCTAIGNKKYGFFFEHQGRFQTYYRATKSESLVVSNCQAKGNLYNFGGARGNDITYENCTSLEEESDSINRAAFYFEQVSRRINLTNCEVKKTFTDVTDTSKYYYDAVYWALNNSVTEGATNTTFDPETTCSRTHAIAFLYRMLGRPGEVIFGQWNSEENATNFTTKFTDVATDASCVDAIKWADDEGILEFLGTEFLPNAACSRETFITILWKYAGEPIVETANNFTDIEEGTIYEDAVNWALNKGIVEETSNGKFEPDAACTRADIVTYLYRYYNSCDTYSITYNLNQGEFGEENPTSYTTGVDTVILNAPIKTGYTFEGWTGSNCTQVGYVGTNYTPEKVVTITEQDKGNKIYTANWTANEYSIIFNANGGTGVMDSEYFTYDCPQVLSENKFKNEGYYFKEWNTKQDGTGTTFKDKDVVNNLTAIADEEITLYAQWELPNPNNRKNIFVGASTYVEMHNIVGGDETWVAARGQGFDWVKNTALPSIESQIDEKTNVIIGICGNDLFNKYLNNGEVDVDGVVEMYTEYFNDKAVEYNKLGANVYFVSGIPVDDSKIDSTTRKINNADIVDFNNKIKTKLEGITFIDVYSGIIDDFNAKNPDLTRDDGSHGTALFYSKAYNIIKKALGQDYTPTFEAFDNMTDIPTDANYKVPLKWAYENAYIEPISETEFGPDKECTRAEVLTLIWRSQGIPYYKSDLAFTDVDQDDLYYDAVMWGVGNGIISGTTNTTFSPDDNCKRGHYIMFLWRIAGKPIVDVENNFTDIQSGKPYINAINWAISEGIIKEDLNGKFRPEEACTREEAITFLYNYYNKANNRKNIFVGASTYVEMHNVVGGDETWVAERGQGFDWIKSTALPSIEDKIDESTNVIIGICGNDLFNKYLNNGEVDVDGVVEMYAEYFNAKAVEYNQLGANVYFVSEGPVDDSKIDSTTRKINNADIVDFNNKIKTKLEGITFIDVYSGIIDDFNAKNPDLSRDDGSHGTALYYSKAYSIIKEALKQDYTPTFEAFDNMTDIPTDANYIVPLKWAYKNAYIDPISETEFGPNNECTRAEALTLIWRSQGIPYNKSDLTFSDVNENDLYYDAVMWGVNKKIVAGDTSSKFSPNEACKRGHFILFIWRLAGKPTVTSRNNFTDVEEGSVYEDAINWAVSEGIIREDLNGEFRPEEACTREDVITFVYNYYNRYKITYNLDGGTLESENPTIYIYGIDEFYLNNPIKDGYEFIGWTGSNGAEPQIEVAITRENIGDLEFVANWKELESTANINDKIEQYKRVRNKWLDI